MMTTSVVLWHLLRILALHCCLHSAWSFLNVYPKIRQVPFAEDPGEPLFLTPLIEAGNITEAIKNARVGPFTGDLGVLSYAGFLTVNKTYNSNLYFWFFPAEITNSKAPVILWLQGGPGTTSLYGLFRENGPYYVQENLTLTHREFSWTRNYSVLYVDNPVGTGFSFTDDERGYRTNQEDIGSDLYNALIQFFQLFPELQDNEFYVTGESYAGKYVPALAYKIHTANPTASLKINLQGLAIGNGFTDPINQLNYADYLYQIGLIDQPFAEYIRGRQDICVQYIEERNYIAANNEFNEFFAKILNVTGFNWYYNYLFDQPIKEGPFDLFVQQESIRSQINVGNVAFDVGIIAAEKLSNDTYQSVKSWLEILLENYRTLLYSGQLDLIVPYPTTVNFLETTEWSAADEFKNSTRYMWKVGDDLAGYSKTAGKLTLVLVRNAGHIVPEDQPHIAFDLISHFVSNIPYNEQLPFHTFYL